MASSPSATLLLLLLAPTLLPPVKKGGGGSNDIGAGAGGDGETEEKAVEFFLSIYICQRLIHPKFQAVPDGAMQEYEFYVLTCL